MITNDRLLFDLADGVDKARAIAEAAWTEQALRHPTAVRLVAELRKAVAAAQELERRAAGCEPPKEG